MSGCSRMTNIRQSLIAARFDRAAETSFLMKASVCLTLVATLSSVAAFTGCDMNTDPAAPDNTARNQVDRPGETDRDRTDDWGDDKTPMDQSESGASIRITADIRRSIMDDDSMSIGAQNCKIITDDAGRVTLRGEVSSQAEKDSIEAKALGVAGVTGVDNQLEVEA